MPRLRAINFAMRSNARQTRWAVHLTVRNVIRPTEVPVATTMNLVFDQMPREIADISPAGCEPLLVRKLHRQSPLSQRDRAGLSRALSLDIRSVRTRSTVGETGAVPKKLAVMLEGWACCYRLLSGGRRQLVAYYLPGDICDLHTLFTPRPDTIIVLLAGARIARLSRESLAALLRSHPALSRALWWDARIASSIEREWLVNLAQRDARARVAHILCELIARAEAVGKLEGDSLAVPLMQSDLADACGLTPAHANRVLRLLREDGLIAWRDHRLLILDRAGLMEVADFSPAYLGFDESGAAHMGWEAHLFSPPPG
jgi:CRP-like cAMP-binding protein